MGARLSFLTAPAPQGLPPRWGFVPGALGHWEGCELGVQALAACGWRGIPVKRHSEKPRLQVAWLNTGFTAEFIFCSVLSEHPRE